MIVDRTGYVVGMLWSFDDHCGRFSSCLCHAWHLVLTKSNSSRSHSPQISKGVSCVCFGGDLHFLPKQKSAYTTVNAIEMPMQATQMTTTPVKTCMELVEKIAQQKTLNKRPSLTDMSSNSNVPTEAGGHASSSAAAEEGGCLDAINETIGLSAVEMRENPSSGTTTSPSHRIGHPNHPGTPRKQISNVSLEPQKKSDIGGASSNLVNSIVGAGIIGIPYALKESGLVVGVLLLILVACCAGKDTNIFLYSIWFQQYFLAKF